MPGKRYNVGKIVNTHGVRGEVRVIATTDFPEERFVAGGQLYAEIEASQEVVPLTVKSHRKHKQFDLLMFEEVNGADEAERLKPSLLQVAEEDMAPLEAEDEYYYHEIIGCRVVSDEGEDVGVIKEIISPGANDVWVIKRAHGKKDALLPYIDDVVQSIDVHEGVVTVHLLEGLLPDEN
ncbi:16S rRNA processing protein RimM [Salsuginibacillus halophilus]|uniref:Ribosome maturation factor RimM n=1 Tax=Salsuginibacillus halophilus TaxID=517424 RepID=A0A2P8HY53_9BACI|nr:ribosome maturation factor RimM [Salsuginibacillus halophilus]PSL51168.1 16S rRNA processing protein RimM [Salsuginibacillus halophilus]